MREREKETMRERERDNERKRMGQSEREKRRMRSRKKMILKDVKGSKHLEHKLIGRGRYQPQAREKGREN